MQHDGQQDLAELQRSWEHERQGPALSKNTRDRMPSEFPTKPLYTPLETTAMDYERDLGFPGDYPYTRGIYPSMYQGRLWTMRQYAGFGTPEETHERFRYLLEQGQGGLLVAFDLPTQLGLDSDDPQALGSRRGWGGGGFPARHGDHLPWPAPGVGQSLPHHECGS